MLTRNNHEVVELALKWVNKKTVYMWGTFGNGYVTNALINAKKAQYPEYYTTTRITKLRSMVGNSVTPFDCIGLIKHILWLDENGKVVYASNGMPDINANVYIYMCKGVSTNFDNIAVGEVVWMKGHIGIYAGVIGGQRSVVEATPNWSNGVQITKLSQRKWVKHGKMPHVLYSGEPVKESIPVINKLSIDGDWGTNTTKALQRAMGTLEDGIISTPKSSLVKAIQLALGVPLTMELDDTTIRAMQTSLKTTVDGKISKPYSSMVAAMQKALNDGTLPFKNHIPTVIKPVVKKLSISGEWDEATIGAMQKHFGTTVDYKFSNPSEVIKEFQRWLNEVAL